MKSSGVGALFFFVLTASGCLNPSSKMPKDSLDNARKTNLDLKSMDKTVSDFAMMSCDESLMEILLGKIAMDKSNSPRVKHFAGILVRNHTSINEDLKTQAQKANIALPVSISDKMQIEIDKCIREPGELFDKKYMDLVLDEHQKEVDKFNRVSESLSDTAIREFAFRTLPILKMHLDSAVAITGKK